RRSSHLPVQSRAIALPTGGVSRGDALAVGATAFAGALPSAGFARIRSSFASRARADGVDGRGRVGTLLQAEAGTLFACRSPDVDATPTFTRPFPCHPG